jgi:hypothetical protein
MSLTDISCARRTTRVFVGPMVPHANSSQKSAENAARPLREAVRSLKDNLRPQPEAAGERTVGTSGTVLPQGSVRDDRDTMGGDGALSVETRFPLPGPPGTSAPERLRAGGRLLSRAGQAVHEADSNTLTGIALLSLAAAVVLLVLALRRSR